MRRMLRRSFVVAALLAALSAQAADPKLKVAMLTVRAEPGVAQGTANLLGEVIAADAARSPKHQLMTAGDVAAIIGTERQRQLLGCAEETNCLAEIGDALGTDLLLDVSVGTVGNLRVLALRLVDARKGQAVRRESETVLNEAELVGASHRLTARLFGLPPPEAQARRTTAFVALGGAGALAAGGVILGVLANSDYQAFKADPFNDPLGDSARAKGFVADGLYAGAIITAGIATILLLTGPTPPPEGAGGGQ